MKTLKHPRQWAKVEGIIKGKVFSPSVDITYVVNLKTGEWMPVYREAPKNV